MAAVSKDIRAISKVIAIVTGGASGLGQATAARLVQNGARVTIADLPTSKGDEVAKQLGNNCAFVPTNVSECCIRQKIHCSIVFLSERRCLILSSLRSQDTTYPLPE